MSSVILADDTAPDAPAMTPARAARWLLWSIGGFTAIIIVWAAFAELNETATAPGRIVPQKSLQVISSLDGGSVAEILVKPGQKVAANAPLLRLDPVGATAEFGRSSTAANALAARIVRLEAEIADTAPRFPPALSAAAPGAVAAEQSLWLARRRDRISARAGADARADGAARALAEARTIAAAAAETRAQAAREVAMLAPLVERGIEPRLSLDRARSELVRAEAAATGSAEAVSRAAAAVREARAAASGLGDSARAAAGAELALARAELASQSVALPALQQRVTRTELRSPIAGTVQRLLVNTIGGSVGAGVPLVEVVPAAGALVVDAQVRPRDIGFVHLGQRAAIRVTAYDSSVYGKLDGKVTRISPDAVVDERGGEGWYLVRIETAADALRAPNGQRLPLGAGMVVEADLLGPSRSVMSYLLSPVTKLAGTAFRER
jgi:adhesin transport system membrane fusion protein